MVKTNINLGYNSESMIERDNILGGPCRPFVGLSIAHCPHFEFLPGKKSARFDFPVPCYIHTLCMYMVKTNIKLGYMSESKNERDNFLDGPCRPFVGLSIALCPHFEFLPGKKSARFDFPVPCYIHTLCMYMVKTNIKLHVDGL